MAVPAILCFAASLFFVGAPDVYGVWGLTVLDPDHEDARGITAAIESARDGHNPRAENPADPWNRKFNYPAIWLNLGRFDIDQADTAAFAACLTALFFVGLLLFPPRDIGPVAAACILVSIFSPAVMLGVKAGNIDQLMFFLTSVAVVAFARPGAAALGTGVLAVLCGFLLKLYPVFAIAGAIGSGRQHFVRAAAVVAAAVGLYVATHWQELTEIQKATPAAATVAYGRKVAALRLAVESPALGKAAAIASVAGVGVAAVLFIAGACHRGRACGHDPRSLAAFHAGAALYVGTFLLGSNFDYRLMFLAFPIPLLVSLAAEQGAFPRWPAILTLGGILISCWSGGLWNLFRHLPYGSPASVVIDESCNWLVFLGLSFLSGITLPAWFGKPA